MHPLGHFGEAVDVANAIAYLASDRAGFMTGSEMVVDGGMTAR
jgi:3(or 17)beta-hydroxysteroid dehydrogenase